jgi:multiple sugar transport system permease protein
MATETSVGGGIESSDGIRGTISKFINDHIVLTLLGPGLLVIGVIFVYPVVWMFYQSLFITAPGIPEPVFDPIYNYEKLFTSARFPKYFGQTLFYATGSLAVSFTWGMCIALAINHVKNQRARAFYTTVILFSWALPIAVVALMWDWVLIAKPFGLLNMIATDIGLTGPGETISLMSNQTLVLPTVTFVDAWLRMPFAMIVFLAGLQAIPQHMYDAAQVDGATSFQQFWNITLPYLRPYMAIVGLISWMFAFRAFSIIFPMTQGGPGTSTTTMAIWIYREGMVKLDFGYGSAIAAFLVAITVIMATFYVTVVLERIEE